MVDARPHRRDNSTEAEVSLLFLLKLLFLPIWLPFKIIGELIEHSGRSHRSRRTHSGQSRSNGRGCLAVVLVVAVLVAVGSIADACDSAAQPAGSQAISRADSDGLGRTDTVAEHSGASCPASSPPEAPPPPCGRGHASSNPIGAARNFVLPAQR